MENQRPHPNRLRMRGREGKGPSRRNGKTQRLVKPFRGCYLRPMNRQEILAKLRESEAALHARGVSHAALFGSRARGDARPDSDIDIIVEFDPAVHVTVFNYAGIKDYIAGLFDGPVDVVSREGLKPYLRPAVITDAIYAF
jgi:predicted nucleotidyltransferase